MVIIHSEEMLEQAKEELQMLETHYPDRFGSLKLELKSFISSLESQHNHNNVPTHSSATTQESTNKKRRKGGSVNNDMIMEVRKIGMEASNNKHKYQKVDGKFKRRDRIDLVLQNARHCLRKIHELKSSLR